MRLFGSGEVPLFLPGVLVSILAGAWLGRPVGRAFRTNRALGWAMVASFGAIVALTLTPLRQAFNFGAAGPGTCDFSRIGLAPLSELSHIDDTSLNVLLFVPLGLTLGLLPRSRRKAAVLLAAVILPFAIEFTQLLLPVLDRGCQSADVIDNLTGLAIGVALGTVAGRIDWSA